MRAMSSTIKQWLTATLCCLLLSGPAFDMPVPHGGGLSSGGGSVPFTALHTFFISPTGNDTTGNGTAGNPWASPNHASVCGDVYVAASGTYNGDFSSWGAVSNCPSTTGGIDGTGGIYTANVICAGNVQTCVINCATAQCNSGHQGSGGRSATSAAMNVNASHWSIQGFGCNGNGAGHRCFQADACLTTSTIIGYIAFINDVAFNTGQGYDTDDCGYGVTAPGNGVDEFAVVGSIAENANSDTICLAAVDIVAPANLDSLAGTHDIFAQVFAWNNSNLQSGCSSDGEAFMFDTWDAHAYSGQGYVFSNYAWTSSWVALQVFMQSNNSSAPNIIIDHNTFFDNEVCTPFASKDGTSEINLQAANSFPWSITTTNNIAQTGRAKTPSSTACNTTNFFTYAMLTATGSSVTFSTTGNWFKGLATGCDGTCDAGDNVVWFNSGGPGTGNTYSATALNNTADLLANWNGAPSCSSFTNVTACMGWNYASQTATSLTPVSDLAPTNSTALSAGVGSIQPGPCAPNARWPTWLKGIVYLQWNGTSLTENAGLVQKPCNV